MAGQEDRVQKGVRQRRFPWLLLILLLGSIYVFWIMPYQRGDRPVQVEFATPKP